jgi:hypothetical protein
MATYVKLHRRHGETDVLVNLDAVAWIADAAPDDGSNIYFIGYEHETLANPQDVPTGIAKPRSGVLNVTESFQQILAAPPLLES